MTIAGEGRVPGEAQLLAVAARVDVSAPVARASIEAVRSAVASWRVFASASGVGRASQTRIAKVLSRP